MSICRAQEQWTSSNGGSSKLFVSLELFNSPIATLDLNLPSTQEVKEVKKVRRKVLRPVAVTSHSGLLALPSRS